MPNVPLIKRQILAVIVSSLVASLSALALFMTWTVFENGAPDWQRLPRDFLALLIFMVPIAVVGVAFFGLPLLFIVRRLGWVSSITRLKLFGILAGAAWGICMYFLFEMRVGVAWLMISIGALNGFLVAWFWLNIVEKFRASQSAQTSLEI
jgi:hypothetical protein